MSVLFVNAQHYEQYYDYMWHRTEPGYARYYTLIEKKDSLWQRKDYFLHERKLQMIGSYTDTSCKVSQGDFKYYHANGYLESMGSYKNGKKDGLWLGYHENGVIADSTVYINGIAKGTSLQWYSNGYMSDSAVWNMDSSGVAVGWFNNGNVSYAGRYAAGYKRNGRWQYFHNNAILSAIEVYNNGYLIDKKYFDEDGKPVNDTTNKDSPATFAGGSKAWQKYLLKNVYFPGQYKLENADYAVVVVAFTVNEKGEVADAEVVVPLHPDFDKIALEAIKKSPKWSPAISHNRNVPYRMKQQVTFSQE